MILKYFKDQNNFGDALNPFIFNKMLPGFFSDDSEIDFFGIGSIIGMDHALSGKERRKIIFSSGYGKYGSVPQLNDKYDIVCVRGPLTAKVLNLDPKKAVTDGAALLKFFDFPVYAKKYDYAYMPHWESEKKFDWKTLCERTGVHYISPMDNYENVLKEILETKVLLAEAMHGAIVADTLRIPWVPVKAYHYIVEFKWLDWATSMDVPYEPNRLTSVFTNPEHITGHFNKLSKNMLPPLISRLAANAYIKYQKIANYSKLEKEFADLKNAPVYISQTSVLNEKTNILLDKLEHVKQHYANKIIIAVFVLMLLLSEEKYIIYVAIS